MNVFPINCKFATLRVILKNAINIYLRLTWAALNRNFYQQRHIDFYQYLWKWNERKGGRKRKKIEIKQTIGNIFLFIEAENSKRKHYFLENNISLWVLSFFSLARLHSGEMSLFNLLIICQSRRRKENLQSKVDYLNMISFLAKLWKTFWCFFNELFMKLEVSFCLCTFHV